MSANDKVEAALGPNWCCWMGRHTDGADHVKMCEHRRETTGEHIQAKLSDYTYGQAAQEGMAFQMSQAAQHTGWAMPGVPTADERRYTKPARKTRRSWSPTKREIQIAAALFLVLVAVSGWVFRALG
jgi:hypothetical protein